MLTRILRVAKESIFSGLNNLAVSTILDRDFNHFGLTEEEVITENIIFSDLEDVDTIWSLMLFSGYLTYDRFEISDITGAKTYFLKIHL